MVRSKKIEPEVKVVIDDSVKEAIKEGLERHREQISDLLADILVKDYLEHQKPSCNSAATQPTASTVVVTEHLATDKPSCRPTPDSKPSLAENINGAEIG